MNELNLDGILKKLSADQYFFPYEYARWEKNKYKLQKAYKLTPDVGGIRFHEYSPNNPEEERACQHDLANAVHALIVLRKKPEFKTIVFSKDFIQGIQNDNKYGKRIKFGLETPKSINYEDDIVAAKNSYRIIRKTISRSGFKLVHPEKISVKPANILKLTKKIVEPDPFDYRQGLTGLKDWAYNIKLRKKNYWWLLLIPLLFTLPHCKQDNNYNIINNFNNFNNSALIILVDKSGSMKATLSKVKTNIKDELEKISSKNCIFTSKYIDIIFFDDAGYSAFGKLEKLSQDSINKLMPFVEAQNASGGTCIKPAFMQAIEEIKEYGKPTTILLLTDGEDKCLDEIFKIDKKNIPKVILDSKTPRFIGLDSPQLGPEQEQIKNLREERLRKLSRHFNGSFGTQK